MLLNLIWLSFFLFGFAACLVQWWIMDNPEIFTQVVSAIFSTSKTAFEISFGLTGVLAFWLGILKIGEQAGAVALLARVVDPLFRRLFVQIPPKHPATGSMLMNISANLLGLDNAATPFGIQAMKQLQSLNPTPESASNAQVLFLTLNASGLTLIPISIMSYRAQLGATSPADVFLPILLTTFFSTLVGLLSVAWVQGIKLHHPVVLAWLVGLCVAVSGLLWHFVSLSAAEIGRQSNLISGGVLFSLIVVFLAISTLRGVNAFEAFIEGAKEGFQTAVTVIPYLVAILVGVAVFRASGGMAWLLQGLGRLVQAVGLPPEVSLALPTAVMKPLSGSGARGLMIDTMKTQGPDSFAGFLSCLFQGATDTTFYIVAVYCGAVGIRRTRQIIPCSLIADLAGVVAAIVMAFLFFPTA